MIKKLRIGVLGTASIAKRFMIPTLLDMKDRFELIGVAGRDFMKTEAFCKTFNLTAYPSYQEILNPDLIDAIYIPLPNSLHYPWIKAALLNRIHVLAEKSLTCSYHETNELCNLAKQHNLLLMENFQFRFHQQLATILEIVKSGQIGDIRIFRSSFTFPPFQDPNNIRYQKDLGGGALLDAGAYPLKVSQIFLGHHLKVQSANLFIDPIFNVDTWGSAMLKDTHSAVSSQIAFGFDHFYQCNLEIVGTKGRLYTNRLFTAGPQVKVTLELETEVSKELIEVAEDHHFKNALNYFYQSCFNDENKTNEIRDNLKQAQLIEELREKAYVEL